MSAPSVDLYTLLDECCLVALAAASVLQSVHTSRLSLGNSLLNPVLKEAGDVKSVATIADIRAQRVITRRLLTIFPTLILVGEEEDDPSIPSGPDDFNYPTTHPMQIELLDFKPHSPTLPLAALSVFIDPLDGTHEFVSGRVQNSTTLIGIAYNGHPIAGIISAPFAPPNTPSLVAGVTHPTSFLFGILPPTPLQSLSLASSSTTTDPTLLAVLSELPEHTATVTPACGSKCLSFLLSRTNICVFNLKTSRWDTCATTAILNATGGIVTDLTGLEIDYDPPPEQSPGQAWTSNSFGVFASINLPPPHTHASLTTPFRPPLAALRNCGAAVDVTRDTHGRPLSLDLLSKITNTIVTSYEAPEATAQRYLMSYCARLHLSTLPPSSTSVFYKRCVMRDLPHAAVKPTLKLSRDVTSYRVEVDFLKSQACRALLDNTGLRIPRCLHHESRPCPDSPLDSKFAMVLEDFTPDDGWLQHAQLTTAQLTAGISALAALHGFFWNGGARNPLLASQDTATLGGAVWKVATHWAPERQDPELMGRIGDIWARADHGATFGNGSPEHRAIGERLQECAEGIAAKAHPGVNHEHYTLIHGDAKAGNLFFKGNDEVAIIDFQWTGFGLGATDLAYYIASCAHADAVDVEGEKEMVLLKKYHAALVGAVPEGAAVPSFDELVEQYEVGVLDVCR